MFISILPSVNQKKKTKKTWVSVLTLIYGSPQGQKLLLQLRDEPQGFPALSHFTMATVILAKHSRKQRKQRVIIKA